MEFPSISIGGSVGLLFQLLPGLITFLVVRWLTARGRKIETAEAILHGLAYTLVVHAIWSFLTAIGSLIPTPDLMGLSLCAVGLGLAASWLTNSGSIYGVLRKLMLTREASWPSIWETAFREFTGRIGEYVVLEFKDRRRLLGAIRGFSADQEGGHVYLARPRWIHSDSDAPEQPGTLLVNATDIASVQFLPFSSETDDARRSTGTNSAPMSPST